MSWDTFIVGHLKEEPVKMDRVRPGGVVGDRPQLCPFRFAYSVWDYDGPEIGLELLRD